MTNKIHRQYAAASLPGCGAFLWAAIFSASMLALRAYGDSTGPVPASSLFAGQASYINNADTLPVGQIVAEEDLTYTHNSQSDYFE